MKKTMLLLVLLAFSVSAHEGDLGPSSLENEFSKLSHMHLPVSYSPVHGLALGYQVGAHEETGHDEHEGHEDVHGDETGLDFHVHPTVIGGFDRIRRLVSLEESKSEGPVLEASDDSGKYLLIESKKWDLGLGLGADAHLPLPLFAAGLNITGLKGKNYYTLRVLDGKYEKRAPLSLPVSEEALRAWRPGDQLTFASQGAMIFSVLMGIEPFIHVGPGYVHSGSYQVKARLMEEDVLEVEVATTKSDSLFFEAGATVISGEAGTSRGHSKIIVYEFDLRNGRAFAALEALFQGRLDFTNQEMAASGGAIEARTSMQSRGSYYSGSFGLPFVYFNGAKGGTFQNEGVIEESHGDEEHVTRLYTTSKMRERFTRGVLSKHSWENSSTTATVLQGEHSLISSVFSWSFSRDRVSAGALKRRLARIAEIFSLPRLTGLELPAKDLGYLKVDFTLNLSGANVLYLLNTKELSGLKKKALLKLEADFETYGHRAFCRIRRYSSCLQRYKNLINNKHQKICSLIVSLDGAYKAKKLGVVTERLAQITQALLASRYLTEAFASSPQKPVIEVRFEGENIKKHVFKSLNF